MTAPTNPLERIPPHVVRDGVLSAGDLAALIGFTLANEAHFKPTAIGATVGDGRVDTAYRTSRMLEGRAFEPWRARIAAIVAQRLPGIVGELGIKPFDLARYELELVRHNDGDFYRRHFDTGKDTGSGGKRVVSMVYYFHTEPKAFEGGALRLYALARDDLFRDIQPAQNRLVAFASWAPHEVMPISCPSRRFSDSRFAINCWARMATPAAP